MEKIFVALLSILSLLPLTGLHAQLTTGMAGVYIKGDTPWSTDGLVMIPSADLSLKNLSIQKQDVLVNWPMYSSIERLYHFSSPLSYNGVLGISYLEDELNGNNADELTFAYTATSGSRNYKEYILTTSNVTKSVGYLEQTFSKSVELTDVTAVTPELNIPLPTELAPNNIVSSNGDDVNDKWVIPYIHHYPVNEVKIFDRFGKLLFSKKEYDNSWDGKYKGVPLPEDTYYYILDINSGEHVLKGYIGIIRENNSL